MRGFKIWYCNKMIALCDYCLRYKDGADGIHDINEVIATKNYFIKQRPTNEG